MYIFLGIIVAAIIISLIVLLIIILKGNKTNKKRIIVGGGYNTESGLKEDMSGKIFLGMGLDQSLTYVVNSPAVKNEVLIFDMGRGQCYKYNNINEIIVGRDTSRASYRDYLCISSDAAISKVHCRISVSGKDIYVEDLNSSNHTYVNGKMITTPTKITEQDEISIGRTRLKIRV